MDRFTYCCTSRASEGRGSSLTFGKDTGMRGSSESSRQRDGNRCVCEACVQRVVFVVGFWGRRKGPATRVTLRGKLEIGSRRKVWEMRGEVFPYARCHAMRSLNRGPLVFARGVSLSVACVVVLSRTPNKALEPTTFAVTARAIEGSAEGRAWTVQRIVARAAPAKVVAHLGRWALIESGSQVTSGIEWHPRLRGIAMPGTVFQR
jgi:hypothetical protein